MPRIRSRWQILAMIRILVSSSGARLPKLVHTTFGSAKEAHTYLRFVLELGCPLGLPLAGGGFEMVDPVLMKMLVIYGVW